MADKDLVEVTVVPIEGKDTEKAWLVETPDGEEQWIPKSLSLWDEQSRTFSVAEWFALREGLI